MRILRIKLVLTIILILFLVIVLIGIGKIKENIYDTSHNTQCKSSVRAYSRLIERGIPARVDKIDCPPKKIELKEGKAKEQIANQMYHCYDNYGRGKLNLFHGEGTFCTVCSIMTSKNDFNLEGLNEYMMENEIPGKNLTYFEFLQHHETFDAENLENYKEEIRKKRAEDSFRLSSDENYAVMFTHVKGKKHIKNFIKRSKIWGAAAGGVATGSVVAYGSLKAAGLVAVAPLPFARPAAAIIGAVGVTAGGVISVGSFAYSWFKNKITDDEIMSLSQVFFRSYTEKTLKEELQCDKIPVSVVEDG